MKVEDVFPIYGEFVTFEDGEEYVRYGAACWRECIDIPTGEIEQTILDCSLVAQLEAAYQEYMK